MQAAALQPGDALQFARHDWTRTVTVDVTNPDGSGSENTAMAQQTRGAPNHSALVLQLVSPGIVEVIGQNIPAGSGGVQIIQLALVSSGPRSVTTRVAVTGGDRVTVTTTTDRVTNPPRCYRPISSQGQSRASSRLGRLPEPLDFAPGLP